MTAGTPEVSSSRSSRTKENSFQESTPAIDRRPTCLTHLLQFIFAFKKYERFFMYYYMDWTISSSRVHLGWLTCSLYGHIHHVSLGIAHNLMLGFYRYMLTCHTTIACYSRRVCCVSPLCHGFRLFKTQNNFDSKRSEPSSRTFLIGEQPNPWDLLQPQDKMSRHRGAEHCRRFGLLGSTSLLSPE